LSIFSFARSPFPFIALIFACSSSSSGDESTAAGALAPGNVRFDTAGNDDTLCQTALFCDDFESFAAGSPPSGEWTASEVNGSVSVDATRPFRGAQSVKATTLATAVSGSTYKVALIGLTRAPVVPVPGEAFYGRMMFYLESAPTTDVHWTFIDATGTVPGQDYSATYRYGGQLPIMEGATAGSQLMANYDTTDFYGTPPRGPNTDCYQHADGELVPVGRWSCAQWFFDGPNAQMRFWLDGQEVTDLHVDQIGEGCVGADATPDYRWAAPSFSRLDVGWESYQTDDERTIWIDDVVIGSSPVSCPLLPSSPSAPPAAY
jgi:hypothetical protein